ncbi:glycosyltransferase [Hymenobacter humi]|uniref:Glycosyltransferase n=1 Tax=Hymenobacter humi TaxID=1411620 RepID=A0ABW2U3Q0_9BACT
MAPTAGVRLLPGTRPAPKAAAEMVLLQSRIIGLNDLSQASAATMPDELEGLAAAHSQWPTQAGSAEASSWQSPAAPYLGASTSGEGTRQLLAPVAPSLPSSTVREAADLSNGKSLPTLSSTALPAGTLQPNAHPRDGDLNFDPDPELPAVVRPAAFSEMAAEPGPDEAIALLAPEDDITLDELLVAENQPWAEPIALEPEPVAAVPVVLMPVLDGLNFRMIQYARRAALVRGRSDFGVIYAPNWPAWLAALEIRNSTGQPMVLYVASLAADFISPGDRGWLLEVERMTLRRARVILVPEESMQHRLAEQYGTTIGEVRVIAAADEEAVQRILSEVAIG